MKYILIDDESNAGAYADALQRGREGLCVKVLQPQTMQTTVKKVKDIDPDGILVDVRLDKATDEHGDSVFFSGLSVADELRRLQLGGSQKSIHLRPVPLIRLSQPQVLQEYLGGKVNRDFQSVFDDEVLKSEIREDRERITQKLAGLALGYQCIGHVLRRFRRVDRIFAELIGIKQDRQHWVPIGLRRSLMSVSDQAIPEVAQVVLSELVRQNGPTVSEKLAMIRLGFHPVGDYERWIDVKDSLASEWKYEGAFSGVEPRYWIGGMEELWLSFVGENGKRLQECTVKERREAVEQFVGKGLGAWSGKLGQGRKPWFFSTVSGKAVDIEDAVPLLRTRGQSLWHETEVITRNEMESGHFPNRVDAAFV